jgi:hypothetical protein
LLLGAQIEISEDAAAVALEQGLPAQLTLRLLY